jgi:uncharacterized damage-inducible protein DinB
MTSASDVLVDGFERLRGTVHRVLDDAATDVLTHRVDPEANTVAWLVWHLTRVQDDHVADAAGVPQVWPDWRARFALPFDDDATGYAQTPDDVAAVEVPAELLRDYFDAVTDRTVAWLPSLSADDHERVVDTAWDPPVTLAVRLVSVLNDTLQHAGQAALVRGSAERTLGLA